MQFRVSFLVALAFGGMSSGAEAAIKVNATIGGTLVSCADAVNVKFSPAATRADMRFTYECVSEGVARTCTPAAFVDSGTGDDYLQNGDPAFKYKAFAAQGGPLISIVCDDQAPSGIAVKGTEFVGEIDGQPIVGCHPAVPISQSPVTLWSMGVRTGDNCGSTGSTTGQCVEFRCPNDAQNRMCFPVSGMTYASRLPDSAPALRQVALTCETMAPMLSSGFDE